MKTVEAIYKSHGGSDKLRIHIGNTDIILPVGPYYRTGDQISLSFEDPHIGKQNISLKVGEQISDNKLEILKANFDYD